MKLTRLSVALLFVGFSVNAFSATGASISGHSKNSIPIASTTHLSTVHSALSNDITTAGKQISSAIAAQGKNDANNVLKQAQINEEALKGQSRGEAAGRVSETYSPQALGYNVCNRGSEKAINRDLKARARKTSKRIQDRLNNHNLAGKTVSVSQAEFAQRITEAEKGAELLYAADKTLSREDWERGEHFIKNTINPIPDTKLPDEVLGDSEAARRYNMLANYKSQALSLPERVMADVHAQEEPIVDGALPEVTALIDAIGYSNGENPYVNDDGKISKRLYQQLQVDSRYGNKEWNQALLDGSQKGVLIEIAGMLALQLDMQTQQLDLLKKIALMDAAKSSQDIHQGLDGAMKKAYEDIVKHGTADAAAAN